MVTLTGTSTPPGRPCPGESGQVRGAVGPRHTPVGPALARWAWGALAGYLAVVVALTCLKSWFAIGRLWSPENQRVRELRWRPFGIIDDASTTFGAAFDILGNVALFVPLGLLAVTVTRRFLAPVLACAAVSVLIEAAQYVFSLGRTDVTDLICNTVGAVAGAVVAAVVVTAAPGVVRYWTVGCASVGTALVTGFVVLTIL